MRTVEFVLLSHCIFMVSLILVPVDQAGGQSLYKKISDAGVLVVDNDGLEIESFRADDLFTPASTVKLITAYLCLQHWGEQHRFSTEFFLHETTATLWVRAGGDPFLVSEEIVLIAKELKERGVTHVEAVGLDVSLFLPNLVVPGATNTNNPYDAVPSALAANFNTVKIERRNGQVVSAESQTPLVPIAREIGESLKEGEVRRVNLGKESGRPERYFAELFVQLLRSEGVYVGSGVVWGNLPDGELLYVHYNSRTLGEVVKGMLKYSTNFIANQLLLVLSAEYSGSSADFNLARTYLQNKLGKEFDWQNFILLEGAGLSPENRLTARQLVELLNRFSPWRHLLPEVGSGVFAKTGTLTGVKSLAGYAKGTTGNWYSFAILLDGDVTAEMPMKLLVSLIK